MFKKITIITVLLTSNSFASVSVSSVPHHADCLANIYCKITGHHDIEITNDTESMRTYHITAGLNSGDGNVDTYVKKDLHLNPHEKYNDHHDYSLYEKYNMSGTYHNSVYAGVYGDESASKTVYENVVVYPVNK